MKTRIERKDVVIDYAQGKIGLMDLFDNAVLQHLRVTQRELDSILEKASDDEFDLIVSKADTFAEKRIMINKINLLYNYLQV